MCYVNLYTQRTFTLMLSTTTYEDSKPPDGIYLYHVITTCNDNSTHVYVYAIILVPLVKKDTLSQ